MLWNRFILLFIMFLLGRHLCFPSSPRYIELADSADFFIARENWEKAEMKIIEALRLEPANFTNSLLLANLGLVQTNKGEYNKAIETLNLGLNLAPNSSVLLNNRAHSFLLLEKINEAKKDLDKSLRIDSIQEWPLKTRGYIYLQENQKDSAEILFNKLIKEFPENISAYSGLAALAEIKGDYVGAKNFYQKVLQETPGDEENREAFILLLIKNNEYTEARKLIRDGIELNPENPMFYLLRGYLHRLNYRPDEALADKKTAISKGLDSEYVSSFIP